MMMRKICMVLSFVLYGALATASDCGIDFEEVEDPSAPLKIAYSNNKPQFKKVAEVPAVKRAVNSVPNYIVLELGGNYYFYKVGWHVGTTPYGPWKPTGYLPLEFKKLASVFPADYFKESKSDSSKEGMYYHGNICKGKHHTHSATIVKEELYNTRNPRNPNNSNYMFKKKSK